MFTTPVATIPRAIGQRRLTLDDALEVLVTSTAAISTLKSRQKQSALLFVETARTGVVGLHDDICPRYSSLVFDAAQR